MSVPRARSANIPFTAYAKKRTHQAQEPYCQLERKKLLFNDLLKLYDSLSKECTCLTCVRVLTVTVNCIECIFAEWCLTAANCPTGLNKHARRYWILNELIGFEFEDLWPWPLTESMTNPSVFGWQVAAGGVFVGILLFSLSLSQCLTLQLRRHIGSLPFLRFWIFLKSACPWNIGIPRLVLYRRVFALLWDVRHQGINHGTVERKMRRGNLVRQTLALILTTRRRNSLFSSRQFVISLRFK